MRFLAILAGSLGVTMALASCQTTANIDTAIQDNLPQICNAADTAHAAFVVVASTGNLKTSTVNKEAAAYAALQTVCADPAGVSSASLLVRAAEAYAIVARALREAEGA